MTQLTVQPLTTYLQQWERRWRLQNALLWLPRIVAFTLAVGAVTLGIVYILGIWTMALTVLAIALVVCAVGASAWVAWQASRPLEKSAQYYDRAWDLQERLSTALEISSGRIADNPLSTYQLEDALTIAQTIDPRQKLPLTVRWREWLLVVPLLVLWVGLVALTVQARANQDTLNPATRDAIDSATEQLRDITQQVAQDTTLDSQTREALLQTLETRIETLNQSSITAEQAFAATSDVQAQLQQAADAQNTQAQRNADAFQNAANALGGNTPNPPQNLAQALQNVQDQLQNPQAVNPDQISEELQRAAEQLLEQNPELAQQLQQAALDAQNGDLQSAQQALSNAQQQAQQAQSQNDQRQQSGQQLGESAQSMSQSASDIAQAEQAQNENQTAQAQNQEGQQAQDSQQEQSQSQDAQQSQGQPQDAQQSQSQSQPAQGGQGDQGDGQSPEGSQGDNGDQQPNDSSQGGQKPGGQQGQQPSSQANTSPNDTQNSQSSPPSGQAQASDVSAQDSSQGQAPTQGDSPSDGAGSRESTTNPDGTGERPFDPVYAPNPPSISQTDQNLTLGADPSQSPVKPGDNLTMPSQNSTVPYNQVFQNYASQASRALESDYVPLGMKDMIRDYFNGLQP